jgi:hypothetical protein
MGQAVACAADVPGGLTLPAVCPPVLEPGSECGFTRQFLLDGRGHRRRHRLGDTRMREHVLSAHGAQDQIRESVDPPRLDRPAVRPPSPWQETRDSPATRVRSRLFATPPENARLAWQLSVIGGNKSGRMARIPGLPLLRPTWRIRFYDVSRQDDRLLVITGGPQGGRQATSRS